LIEGIITEDGVPGIEVNVGVRIWLAIIDSGFNGDLELPRRLHAETNAQFVGRATSILAANQRIEEDVFLVDFRFDDQDLRVQATFSDSEEILIGTGLMRHHRLQIDFPAGTVVIVRSQGGSFP
jgi:predicted aspartyl protease